MPTNSELLLAGYDAWNCDDCDAWLALLDPEIHIHTSGVFPDLSAEYRGPEGARKFWRQLREPWETFSIEVERMEDEGDRVSDLRRRGKDIRRHQLAYRRHQEQAGRHAVEQHVPSDQPMPGRCLGHRPSAITGPPHFTLIPWGRG